MFTVTFPAPPKDLTPNARMALTNPRRAAGRLSRLKREFEGQVGAAVLLAYPNQDWPRMLQVKGTVTFTYGDRIARDIDNLFFACKRAIDHIVTLGVVPDDGPENIVEWTLRYRVVRGVTPYVTLTLEEVA